MIKFRRYVTEQVKIYHEFGRYAGWPANYGIWSWENEIVVGFTVGHHDSGGGFHARDRSRPFVGMQARSLDGGQTWEVVDTPCRAPGGKGLSADEHMQTELGIGNPERQDDAPVPCPGVDFMHPNFALMCARSGLRAGAVSWFYTSQNRCQTWDGPYALPSFGQTGIAARTDYLALGPADCLLFLTAAKPNGQEGHVFCARTRDGARSFDFVSWIGDEPAGFTIMPAHVLLPNGRILVAMRCRDRGERDKGTEKNWIDLYASDDEGATWTYLNRPVEETGQGGNPPTLMRLSDGPLCLTYGFRNAPFRMCARLSDDDGETWGEEIVLRDRGGNHDIGYPRSIQRPDGKVVTVYYFNDVPDGERYVEATIWQP